MISDLTRSTSGHPPAHRSAAACGRARVRVSRRVGSQLVAATLLALLAVALLAGPATAHAVLTGSSPVNGAELDAAPEEIVLSFNEPVAADEQSLRLFDTDATRVDDGPLDTADDQIAVAVPDELGDGAYIVAYRVVSDDGHPIAGTLTFTVGEAMPLDAEQIAAIAGADDGMVGAVGATLRGVGYLAVLLAAGAVAFGGFIGRRPADRHRAAQLVVVAATVGVVATLLHLPVQAAAVSGQGVLAATVDAGALGGVLASGFGVSAILRLLALVASIGLVLWVRRGRAAPAAPPVWLWFTATLALASYLLDGHQRTVEPSWLMLGGDAVHLAGAAVWAGGLVLLFGALRARRRDDDPAGAARLVARFSTVALWSVLALSLAGTAMSLPLVRSLDALTSTTYGWLLLTKVGLVGVVIVAAAYNRRTLVPAITAQATPAGAAVDTTDAGSDALRAADPAVTDTGAAWERLVRTVRLEIVVLAAIGLLTGFLATTQPAAEAAGLTGPVVETVALTDDLDVDLIIDPAEPGLNAIHVYVVDAAGQPNDRIEDLRLEFTYLDEGIGPIEVEPFVAGPGHWTGNVADLTFAGAWEVRVIAGEDRFTEHTVTVPFQLAG